MNIFTFFSVASFGKKWYGSFLSALGLIMLLISGLTFGQTTIASDGFNNTSTLFTVSGGTYYTGNSAAGDRPASSPFAVEGTYSVGVTNGTATLTSSVINTSSYSGISMTMRLASFSIGSTGNGADGTDVITVEVSPDGGTTYYSTVTVAGNGNAYWAYSGTGNASTTYDGNATPVDFAPAGGGARTTDGYSTITVTNLPAVSNLKVRITLVNNAVAERWVVDDFKITGTAGITSAQTGNWNSTSTWLLGVVPTATDNVIIATGHTVTLATATNNTRNSGTTTVVNGTLATNVSYINNGSTTINGTFQINNGGFGGGTTDFVYGIAGNLVFNHNNGIYYGSPGSIDSGHKYWPGTNSPFNVTVNTNSPINLGVSRTVAGTFQTAAGVTLSSATLTLNGTAQINAGGFFNQAPTYGPASKLIYATGTVYNRGSEWSSNVAGVGYPNEVQISGNTTIDYPSTGAGAFSQNLGIDKNLTIDAGSSLYMGYGDNGNKSGSLTIGGNLVNNGNFGLGNAVGGDFSLKGNWTRGNTANFYANGRTVNFIGTVAQTITSTPTFDYLSLNNLAGLTLTGTVSSIIVNQNLTLSAGKITIGANNITLGNSGTIAGANSTNYVVTNGIGQLKRTVGASVTEFPVGNTIYNPITFNNSGTSDVYGVRVVNGAITTGANNTKTVSRSWVTTEAIAGGSNLAVVAQYNTGEPNTGFAAATTPFIGFYNGTSWSQVGATIAGSNPFTATSTANISLSDLTAGTQYFAIGKDNAFLSTASNLVITAITPTSPTAGSGFSVTVRSQDAYGSFSNVTANTDFTLSTNGNAGTIGGTTTGTLTAGTSTVTVTGVTLSTAGTGATITATRTSGDILTLGTSATFNVLAAADRLAFVGVPATGNVGVNLATFTVEARRPDLSVDNTYTGIITLSKASGIGVISGTLTATAVAGIATFSSVQFDAADTYTLNANSGSLTQATSGNVVVSLAPVVLAGWDFFGQSSPSTFAATTFNSNLVSTSSLNLITRGAGAASSAGGNSFRTVGFQNDGISTANTDYFQTTLKTVPGQSLSLSTITGNVVGTTSYSVSPGVSMQFAYSLDGNTFTLIGSPVVVSGTTPAIMPSISTTGVAVLQNISPETTVYIRYYATGQTSTGGWGFSSATSGTNGLAFSGNILCTQPTAYAVTGGGSYCTGGTGVAVGLANSQSGISYQLKLGGVNTGSAVAGTGAAISFGNQTAAGTYTVVATNTNGTCNLTTSMTGNAIVSLNPLPDGTLTNGGEICAGTQPQLTFTSSAGTGPFTLVINGQTYNNISSGVVFTATGTPPTTNTTYNVSSISGVYCTNPSPTVSTSVTVNPLVSAGTVSGTASVFLGNTTPFTTNGTAGGTWSSDNAAVASVDTASGVVTGNTLGTAQITYTVSSGCGSPVSSSATITVTDVTTWNGTTWNHGAPTIAIKAAIDGDYNTALNGNISAYSLLVNTGGKLVITANTVVTLQDQLINNGNVMLESDGNLLQNNDIANTGDISARREITIKDNNQYNYLISPLIGSNLKINVYEDQTTNVFSSAPFTLYYNETNNKFYNSSGAYIQGRGLAVKEPAASIAAPWGKINAFFTGVPTNGSFTYSLANTGTAETGYNLVGNPYPSNIDIKKLYDDSPGQITGKFLFWDNTANAINAQQDSSYKGAAYAIFSADSGTYGTGNPAPGNSTVDPNNPSAPAGTKTPNRIVKVGQAFMVKATGTGLLNFKNTQRLADQTGSQFFGKNQPMQAVDRYWLELVTPSNIVISNAVVYFEGGNNEFAKDDSEETGTSDALFSYAADKKVVINGRKIFDKNDILPLGTRQFISGINKVQLGKREGIFANGQDIYLKDKQTGIITNLSEGNYTFTATAGENTGRFEMIYEAQTTLTTDGSTKESLVVYRTGEDFIVKSGGSKITQIQLYDLSGRLFQKIKSNELEVKIAASNLPNGTYIMKIFRNNEILSKKIIK